MKSRLLRASHLAARWAPLCLLAPLPVLAQALPALTSTPAAGGGTQYSLSMQTLLLMTSLSFIPAMVLMTTSFTRIIIVMSLLRHALGTQTSPPNQVLVGLSLFLTFFIMSPVADRVYTEAWQPLSENRINFDEAVARATVPVKAFMLKQIREPDLNLFSKLAKTPRVRRPKTSRCACCCRPMSPAN
jgi:flagellar biosynthetic protein FliP